jgi:hypothetical protein
MKDPGGGGWQRSFCDPGGGGNRKDPGDGGGWE